MPCISWLPFQIVISFKHMLRHPWYLEQGLSLLSWHSFLLWQQGYILSHTIKYTILWTPQQTFLIAIKNNGAHKLSFLHLILVISLCSSTKSCKLPGCDGQGGRVGNALNFIGWPWKTGFAEAVPVKAKQPSVQKLIWAHYANSCMMNLNLETSPVSLLPLVQTILQMQWIPAPEMKTWAFWCCDVATCWDAAGLCWPRERSALKEIRLSSCGWKNPVAQAFISGKQWDKSLWMSHAENQYFLCSLNHKEDGCPGYIDLSIIHADPLPVFHGNT